MSIALTLLDDVRWRGARVTGERPQALLAALAAARCRSVADSDLIGLVWGSEPPGNSLKSLQVLVSRVRAACGPDVIVRDSAGYRLGAGPGEVDSARLSALAEASAAALDRDAASAAAGAQQALALAAGLAAAAGTGPLADVRQRAAADVQSATITAARARSRCGAHAEALPLLAQAHAQRPADEGLLADLLRSEAAIAGPAAALDRYERYRRDLAGRLGTDPGEVLQREHRALLAADRPVRQGVRYDATELIGRDGDLQRLRAQLAGSRVVSIVGPGGLGKTRLAHALARSAPEPVVHVVELASVTAAEDLAGELGSALGVRDPAAGRRAFSGQQRSDIRARIAQLLGQAPCLLVLDNCEHLLDAVADLVAGLVALTADLRVLTTSRAPLSIAAETVYLLGELAGDDSERLFRERAVAARPSVALPGPGVQRIVARLDGLPLAIELAAAKVRAMSLEEIDRRLADRFALLRGGDRSAPDRHQTLLAVIGWSWNLLNDAERRGLGRLALFPDGFTLAAAEAVLGAGAVDAVAGLVSQSLLSVRETGSRVRYRMLETVREFGLLQLASAGEEAAARAAHRQWAVSYARDCWPQITGTGQFAAVDALEAEETSLADELRSALADGDHRSAVPLLTALAGYWTIRGEHARLIVLADAVAGVLDGWRPPPELAGETLAAVALTVTNALFTGSAGAGPLMAMLARLWSDAAGAAAQLPGAGTALVRVLLATSRPFGPGPAAASRPAAPAGGPAAGVTVRETAISAFGQHDLELLATDSDRHTALTASQWLAHWLENSGDVAGALEAAQRSLALAREEDGPWTMATAHHMLAELVLRLGDRAAGIAHAQAALPVMARLGASDDEMQLRFLLVMCAITDGRLDDARAELRRMYGIGERGLMMGLGMCRVCTAELALASGDQAEGLRLHRENVAATRQRLLPGVTTTGFEPWNLFAQAVALSAHARFAAADDVARGRELFRSARLQAVALLGTAGRQLDFPAAGHVLVALGAWVLLRPGTLPDSPDAAADAAALLVLAERFGFHRVWEQAAGVAQQQAPGLFAQAKARYAGRPPPDLVAEALALAERLPG